MTNYNQKIKFLDVGHADSSVIYLYDGNSNTAKVVIIDVVDADKLMNELSSNDINIVDMLIISHTDADHCRGVNDFLEKFSAVGVVKKICYNIDRKIPTKTMRLILKRFLELYRKQEIIIVNGMNDTNVQKRELISIGGTKLSLIYPNTAEATEAYLEDNTNDMSIVCLYESKDNSIIFPGDLEEKGWEKLFKRMPDLKCKVLKMPHHGAFYPEESGMGTKRIIEILQPQITIISTGENERYNHPCIETINVLREKNVQVYCTEYTYHCHSDGEMFDKKCYGNIEIEINDSKYRISTERNNRSSLECPLCIENV